MSRPDSVHAHLHPSKGDLSELFVICALGFVLGVRHAADPDHVVAVTTIVARNRSLGGAAMIGALWGVGHTITVLLAGGAIILFGWVIPPRVGLSMEFSVGAMLVVLGIIGIAGAYRSIQRGRASIHSHAAGGSSALNDTSGASAEPGGRPARSQGIRSVLIGVVHGMAGSAAVALLVMAAIGRSTWALLYLLLFGLGTVIGMMLITLLIGVPFAATSASPSRHGLGHGLRLAAGVLSLGFGLLLAYQIGWVDGLFTATPTWEPR